MMNSTKALPHFPPLAPEREPTYERGYWREELMLAFRNRGMPLEALRYATTPTGLHFLLTHFDIPAGDGGSWRLEVGGLVERPLTLRVADLKARPRVTRRVTMECAGNGRGLLHPRPVSQPWLQEAIGTAEWTGTPLAAVLEEAGSRPDAIEVVFTGADAGMEANQVQRYRRSLKLGEALRDDILLAYRMNGEDLPPQHGGPVRVIVPGWYGMASVKWLVSIDVTDRPFDGHYMVGTYRYSKLKGELGEPVTHQRVRALMISARYSRVLHPHTPGRGWTGAARGSRLGGSARGRPRRDQYGRRQELRRRAARAARSSLLLAGLVVRLGCTPRSHDADRTRH